MNSYKTRSQEIYEEIIENRRYLHQHAELGFDLDQTRAFVTEKLKSYGYEPSELGGGITATVGKPGKTIMLRADMDALPQEEASGLPFACTSGACHSCGHDAHVAMLLGAARLLKENEDELQGTVKFCFQPCEELLSGAKSMIDAGILVNPQVDAAMGMHINYGPVDHDYHVGTFFYGEEKFCSSADAFEITITGKSAHGSTPHAGVNALSAAANIVVALQQFFTLQQPSDETSVLSVCSLHSGSASNIIPEKAVMQGTIRTYSRPNRNYLLKRLEEIAKQTAAVWGAEAEVDIFISTPPNVNDPELTAEMGTYCREVLDDVRLAEPQSFSEDFAYYGEYVPTFFGMLYAGGPDEGYPYKLHDPHATFDETVMPYGVAAFCQCATRWLENHQ